VVGVNRFTTDEVSTYEPLKVNPAIESEQIARLTALKSSRDNAAVAEALEEIRIAAHGDANLLYPMKKALQARATVGEVSDALRDVWGQYTPRDAF
jgi:methylmalonyl-CoA mutase N-terminal domain/subunit